MALTADQMNRIAVDFLNGRPQRETGAEAEAFLAEYAKDVEKIRAKGGEVVIPNDQPDPD
jgi:hypothetical protein